MKLLRSISNVTTVPNTALENKRLDVTSRTLCNNSLKHDKFILSTIIFFSFLKCDEDDYYIKLLLKKIS